MIASVLNYKNRLPKFNGNNQKADSAFRDYMQSQDAIEKMYLNKQEVTK